MSASDDIFPKHKHYDFVQTEWAGGWIYAVVGFGSAARMLTERRAEMHASVDQIGLAVFFLQRHRVELVVKQTLVDLGEDPVAVVALGHSLRALWKRLGEVVTLIEPEHWADLDGRLGDFLETIHRADTGSFAYRYPVDVKGKTNKRADFIDLDALERHADNFESALHGYTDWLDAQRQEALEYEAEMNAEAREYEIDMRAEYGDDHC